MLIQRLLLGLLCVAVTKHQADSGVTWKELPGCAFSHRRVHPFDTFLPPDLDSVPPQPGALDLDFLLAAFTLL